MIIDILRHGEPEGGSKYRGQLDDPLSEKGWQQMHDAVAEKEVWQQIVSSDLSRCADFARKLGAEHDIEVELEPAFREIGFGDWEGRSAEQLLAEHNDAITAFWRDPLHNTPPDAESLTDFQQRVVGAWLEMLQRHANKHLLLIGHAGVMRILLLHILELPLESFYRFDPRNASMVRIRVESGRHGEQYAQLVFPGP